MKAAKAVVAVVTALTLGACYWVPPQAQTGTVSLNVRLAQGVLPPSYTGDLLRATLYDPSGVSALYAPYLGVPPSTPAPGSRADFIRVTAAGAPYQIEGYDYYEMAFDPQRATSGSFTIPDIAIGRKYRLHLQWLNKSPTGGPATITQEGLSTEFEVPPGSVADIAIDLYLWTSY